LKALSGAGIPLEWFRETELLEDCVRGTKTDEASARDGV
jgi:hypothetical protein